MLYPALIYIAFSYFRNGSSCRTYNQIIRTFCKGRFIMQLLVYISNYIVPFLILSIIVYGLSAKVNVYETFIKGAKSGFFTVVRIMPTLIGLMAAVGILRASGFLDFISGRSAYYRKNVLFVCSDRTPPRYFQTIRHRLPSWYDRIDLAVLYRDNLLYDECLLYDCRNQKIPLHARRCAYRYIRGTCRKRPPRIT